MRFEVIDVACGGVKEQTGLLLICALTTHVYSRGEGVKPAGSATAFPDSDYPVPEKRISKYYHVPKHERGLRGPKKTGPGGPVLHRRYTFL